MNIGSSARSSSGSQRKVAARKHLEERNHDSLVAWSDNTRNALGILSSLLFDRDPLICWRAIEAIGQVAAVKAHEDIEKVRLFLRRLLWLMNDESGGICWYAPEAIAEVLVQVPELREDFGPILLSFIEEEPFEAGVRWGIARLADTGAVEGALTDSINSHLENLRDSLTSGDARIRGRALLAIRALNVPVDSTVLDRLVEDSADILVYSFQSGQFDSFTVSQVAGQMATG